MLQYEFWIHEVGNRVGPVILVMMMMMMMMQFPLSEV